ncbi:hypothetical protein [Methanoculleus chikugoensis]|uniref:hypothetical protein n=1 Tax=Methanoculleus chikugoensis TaxID=118126 RepID=UPI001FB4E352|nr:hypothetical protein [Methanoculleus chikugoensis]
MVVGRDTRTTSELLEHAVVSGMLSVGATVYSCGIAPTPTVAHATRNTDAGCMITASHNPPESYNGGQTAQPPRRVVVHPPTAGGDRRRSRGHTPENLGQAGACPAHRRGGRAPGGDPR